MEVAFANALGRVSDGRTVVAVKKAMILVDGASAVQFEGSVTSESLQGNTVMSKQILRDGEYPPEV